MVRIVSSVPPRLGCQPWLFAPVASLLILLAGCGSGGSASSGPTANGAVTVTIYGSSQTRLGTTTQFSATVANSANQSTTWQVNGVTGGSTATGTISTTGLYTAPASVPSQNPVTVTAISLASPTISGTLSESIWNPIPVMTNVIPIEAGTTSSFLINVTGTGFVQGATIDVGGVAIPTTYVSSTSLQANRNVPTTSSLVISVVNPDPGTVSSSVANVQFTVYVASVAAASRLLDQATFGPTVADITHVQTIGLDAYITEQLATPTTILPDVSVPPPTVCATNTVSCEQSEWWQTVLTGPDQLRQRVAMALSEIMVISTNSVNSASAITYQNMLANDAFGNFLTLTNDVTLSTGMGNYLNTLNSYKPGNGQIANENFAREELQLFSIGLYLLNQDGTPQLDASGNMIPSYTEAQVQAFARMYTGWTYQPAGGGTPSRFPASAANYYLPMAAVQTAHDTNVKMLLNGVTLPAGQTAETDLAQGLANIFAHPNVGPFICRQLIQHLVTSNPSHAYVNRISTVFANNGKGVRGDMAAVVRSILMDSEARAGDTNPNFDGGHLREPMLYLANQMRGLGFINNDPNNYYASLSNYSGSLGERPYSSASVFNFFPPSYVIPGTTINAPEFALENTASAVLRLTLANSVVYNGISGMTANLGATGPFGLMASSPGNLVDYLGQIFMHGQMPTNMRAAIVNHITTLTDMGQRVRVAIYLIITSSQYKVIH